MNLKTKNNKNIYIFDNVFESHLAQKFYIFILNSFFKINFLSDSSVLDYHNKFSNSFGSSFSPDDVESLGFLKNLPDEIKNKFNICPKNMSRCLINIISPMNAYHPHDDSGKNVKWGSIKWSLIYYVNLKWQIEWAADTLFLDENREKIEYFTQCIPNRIVIFDATIPHIIRPSTIIAPQHRFSINMTFLKNE
jgi:hypothetical protein